ncbi:glycosyltransferase family 2 protein [Neisseria animalis]|uniref:Glycosyltransferase n=1 Tax=Neisseria animalis TaxID=492 RepID=A0A5P3MPH7_NEIAN|nr:glycosyltransferase family 2 protein [Neisseria animalis]QEY23447.1 glycosyltransferase [Neisseria animalis]ROW33292.1 glycosyltransferase [Neisseria animalis]VEE08959.1 glycosyltransferase [Neisseria animalis]
MSRKPTLDIVIPCYNAADTLEEAVESAVGQPCASLVWLVDDGSQDGTAELIRSLAARYANVRAEFLPRNSGVSVARNWGALQSQADFTAFLDADDVYETDVLSAAYLALEQFDYLSLVRLKLKPWGFPERYTEHAGFSEAWQRLAMTVGGNMVFRRSILLACGGFPQDGLFRRFGGEDAALGIALTRSSVVATAFDEQAAAVRHRYRAGIHAERLLDVALFGRQPERITEEDRSRAEAVTEAICRRLAEVKAHAEFSQTGIMPLKLTYA